jgi:hypothetical protein
VRATTTEPSRARNVIPVQAATSRAKRGISRAAHKYKASERAMTRMVDATEGRTKLMTAKSWSCVARADVEPGPARRT